MKTKINKYIKTEINITMTLDEAERLVRLTNKAEEQYQRAKSNVRSYIDDDEPIPLEIHDLQQAFEGYYDLIDELADAISRAERKEIEVKEGNNEKNTTFKAKD